jgi:hypothetical protein
MLSRKIAISARRYRKSMEKSLQEVHAKRIMNVRARYASEAGFL